MQGPFQCFRSKEAETLRMSLFLLFLGLEADVLSYWMIEWVWGAYEWGTWKNITTNDIWQHPTFVGTRNPSPRGSDFSQFPSILYIYIYMCVYHMIYYLYMFIYQLGPYTQDHWVLKEGSISLSSFLAFLGLQSSSGFAENCVQNRISSQSSPFYWVFSRMISWKCMFSRMGLFVVLRCS